MKLSEAIAALERGEEVEWRCKRTGDDWSDLSSDTDMPTLLPKDFEFRLKPKSVEPVKLWLNFCPNQVISNYKNKHLAESAAILYQCKGHYFSRIAVPFREFVPLTNEERSRLRKIKEFYNPYQNTDGLFLLDLLKKQGVE